MMKRFWMFCLGLLMLGQTAVFAEDFYSAGVKIHYQVAGRGEPVILIHGLLANATLNWGWPGIIAALTNHYQVIAPDCRGHGLSDRPTADGQYGVKMVEDVVRLMDHLKIKQASLVGYSMGGMITMKMLVLHPERVRSAVIGGMGWLGVYSGFPVPDRTVGRPNPTEACIRGFAELVITEKQVRAIKTPLLVLIGDHDPLREEFVEPLHEVRPDVPIKVIPNANHMNAMGKPKFKTELEAFLAQYAARGVSKEH